MSKIRDEKLTKESQEYGVGNRFKEYFTPPGWRRMLGETFSDAYKNRMEILREADNQIRAEAKLLNDNLKGAQRAFKDNRFIDVAHYVSQVNNGILSIVSTGKAVTDLSDKEISEYYTRTEDSSIFDNYFDKRNHAKYLVPKVDFDSQLKVYAGISDFFNRLMGTSLEKSYWKRIKERKLAVQSLVKQTEKIVATVLTSLQRMGSARAKGDIAEWIAYFERIKTSQAQFQVFFKAIYDKNISDLVEMARQREPKPELSYDPMVGPDGEATSETTGVSEPVSGGPVATEFAPTKEDKTVPVVQQVKTDDPSGSKKGPGRPRAGDSDRQFDQLSQLMKSIKPVAEEPSAEAPIPSQPENIPVETSAPKTDAPAPVPSDLEPEMDPVIEEPKAETKPEAKVEPAVESVVVPPVTEAPKATEAPKGKRYKVKEQPVHVDIKGKEPEPAPADLKPEPSAKEDEPSTKEVKKVTLVILPKGGADGLDILGANLAEEFGHKVVFVTKSNGREVAEDHNNKGYIVDVKQYSEVEQFGEKKSSVDTVLSKFDDTKFVSGLPRLGNGDFHISLILDLPKIEGLNKEDKQKVVAKLWEIRNKEVESGAKPEAASPELEPTDIASEIEELEGEGEPVSEDDEEKEIFIHSGKLQELVGKSISELGEQEIFDLIQNPKYLALLPKIDDNFNTDLIKKFPEFKALSEEFQDAFLGSLRMIDKAKNKKKRTAATTAQEAFVKLSNERFFKGFVKVAAATDDVTLLAAMLCKYSEEIDELDPETSKKLLKHAQNLLND